MNKLIQVSQASDDLTPQSGLASGTVRILSGSELSDGLMLAPGLSRLLSHRRQMFGRRSGNGGEPALPWPPVNAAVVAAMALPFLNSKKAPKNEERCRIDS